MAESLKEKNRMTVSPAGQGKAEILCKRPGLPGCFISMGAERKNFRNFTYFSVKGQELWF
ncbi:MAG: hypothetical protein EGQ98_08245 [Clostridium sp.]|nr:hypothetical protein [Clostridium sp.]